MDNITAAAQQFITSFHDAKNLKDKFYDLFLTILKQEIHNKPEIAFRNTVERTKNLVVKENGIPDYLFKNYIQTIKRAFIYNVSLHTAENTTIAKLKKSA